MAEKYKATPNNPEENLEQMEQQQEQQQKEEETKENLKDAAKLGIKVVVTAKGLGAISGLVDPIVDAAAETPVVGEALDQLSKNEKVQKAAETAKPLVDVGNTVLDAKGGKGAPGKGLSGGMPKTGGAPAGLPKTGGTPAAGMSKPAGQSPTGSMTGVKPQGGDGISEKPSSSSSPLSSSESKNPLDLKDGLGSSDKSSDKSSVSDTKDKIEKAQKVGKFIAKYPYVALALLIVALIAFLLFIFMLEESKGEGNEHDTTYTYEQCKEITVKDNNGKIIDIVSLEEYIMGVVNGEIGVFKDLETAKALSVAARTYVMDRSNSCSKAIISSSNVQVYNPNNISPLTKQAVTETAGLVLKRNESFISAEYDAFCYKGEIKNGNYTICQPSNSPEGELQIPTVWAEQVAASEGSSISYLQNHSHGRGMSQFGAFYLSTVKKWDYEHILHYFYGDDVLISKMIIGDGELVQLANGFLMRNKRPIRSNSYYYEQTSENFGIGTNEGECAWYGVHRTNEILNTMGLTNQYSSVSSGGNGGQFCESSDYKQFDKSYDMYDSNIQPGTVVSKGTSTYGHVFVIENVIRNTSGKITSVEFSEAYLKIGTESESIRDEIWNMPLATPNQIYEKRLRRKTVCEQNNSGCFKYNKYKYSEFISYLSGNFKCYMFISKNKSA